MYTYNMRVGHAKKKPQDMDNYIMAGNRILDDRAIICDTKYWQVFYN